MRTRRSKSTPPRLSRDADRLVSNALALGASGSRPEDLYWEQLLYADVERLLDNSADMVFDAALDVLHQTPPAYEALIEVIENSAECIAIEHEGARYRILLVAAPILSWSKYGIASGALRSDHAQALHAQLSAHIASEGARIAMAPYLYSIDQLPKGYSGVRALTRSLGQQALGIQRPRTRPAALPETAPLLYDTRFLLAAIAAPHDAPLFRWQDSDAGKTATTRDAALAVWREQGGPTLQTALSGCSMEMLLPDGFHVSCRESDRMIRPYGVPASMALLDATVDAKPDKVRAIVAPFGEQAIEEYRIAFTVGNDIDVLHGVIWPLYGAEQGPEPGGPLEQIEALLRQHGVTHIQMPDEIFPMEYCDDCGSPLYADAGAELVHAELPEDAEAPNSHLH